MTLEERLSVESRQEYNRHAGYLCGGHCGVFPRIQCQVPHVMAADTKADCVR